MDKHLQTHEIYTANAASAAFTSASTSGRALGAGARNPATASGARWQP